MENILLRENKTGKSMMDCYFYILYKKGKIGPTEKKLKHI